MRKNKGRFVFAVALVAGCQSAAVVAPTVGPKSGVAAHEASVASVSARSSSASSASASDVGVGTASSATVTVTEESASAAVAIVEPPQPTCMPQQPFDFLIRKNYTPVKAKKNEFKKSLAYRTRQYGFVKGWSDKAWNTIKAKAHAVTITLFGLPVSINERIVPALRCAEQEIQKSCAASSYTPATLSGFRDKNTYHGGEVTNHLWGIALDIDPELNPCCGCTKKWKANPKCKLKVTEEFERMAMPKCWVDAFEKYGFYWLGHDVLKDTMHFEFLADPEKVMSEPSATAVVSEDEDE